MYNKIIIGEVYKSKNGKRYLCEKVGYERMKFVFKSLDPVDGYSVHKLGLSYNHCKNFILEESCAENKND